MFLRLGPGHPAPAELPDVAEAAPLGDGGGLLAADARHAGEHQRGPVSHRHVEQGLELLWSHGQSCLESNICVIRVRRDFMNISIKHLTSRSPRGMLMAPGMAP